MATHANSTRVSAREVMKRAWRNYHLMTIPGAAFSRRMFAMALRNAWYSAKLEAQIIARRAEEQDERSELEVALDRTSYLPAHMSASAAQADICARYAARGIYA
ncbi:hypothetical protein [Antarcticirhabdus aurantiaca]|uniref:Uncharacterized protein n=1 Tax=Antarcticirhabdus aurantiaca TaxID=2606717 RepID=A0ACD4NQ12_9HYPH|nr:hypothetical protein [Antarcticirhabdus aurantiaca]WAJ28917.1 hypothetical protein OXU80_01290 [Jeongeuplla avenae]